MRVFGALLVVILFVGSPLFGQADNPNAGLDAWREAMAEYNRVAEEQRQQYAADRDLWEAQFEEATRPATSGERVLMALQYAGDKALTGVINYYSNRAAIRSEMGQFDTRFDALRGDVVDSRNRILAGVDGSRNDILTGIAGSEGRILTGITDSEGRILTGITDSEGRILTGITASEGRILTGIGGSEGRILTGIGGSEGRILTGIGAAGATFAQNLGQINGKIDRNLEILEELRLPRCSSPFGSTSQEPCRP